MSLQPSSGLVQAEAVIRCVPKHPRPGMPAPLLPLTAGTGARAGVKPVLAGAACSRPCWGHPALRAHGHSMEQAALSTCSPLASGVETYWVHLEPSVGAGVLSPPPHIKLLCFGRAKHSQLLPQLMGAAVRAQQSWKSSPQLHSWE